MADNIVTPEARASFVQVFEPKIAPGATVAKYGISLLFPAGTDLSELKKQAKIAADEKWGDKKPANLKSPFLDAGNYEYAGYEKGMVLVRCTAKNRPGVVDQRLAAITDPDKLYSGCYVRCQIRAFAYDSNGNRGISFGLQNVQKVRDGEPLGGRQPAEKAFEAIAGGDEPAGGTSAEDLFGTGV